MLSNSYSIGTLQKALIVSLQEAPDIERMLLEASFEHVEEDPDFVICYGGDGTLLHAEREFPGVPKLTVKKANAYRRVDYGLREVRDVLMKIKRGHFRIQEEMKVEARFMERTLTGLNEIQIHTKLPVSAIRFSLSVDGSKFENLIGDGAIIATPFGSTGYYKSTGGKRFLKGIGISFNNLHNQRVKSFVVSEDAVVRLKVIRGPALILADNDDRNFELEENDVSSVRKAEGKARFIYT
jgi:NAD+ kinase